jgi:hypothetical protein
MEAVRFDLRWKVALCLPLDHEGFHPTSLVKFRARLLLHGKERVVFERSLELATELGLISGQVEQILDSTPMLGAAAVQDTATLVRCAVRRLLDAVKVADAQAAKKLRCGRSPSPRALWLRDTRGPYRLACPQRKLPPRRRAEGGSRCASTRSLAAEA